MDFAVAADLGSVAAKLQDAGWERSENNLHRWTRNSNRIDVIPVTNQDILAGEVDLGDGMVMSVVGFDLAYDQAERVSLGDGIEIWVPRLPALVLLKMISWIDRPNVRTKDLGDLFFMIDAALPGDDERRWSPPLSDMELEFEDQSAFVAGSDLGKIVQPAHLHWVRVFVDRMRDDDGAGFATLLRMSGLRGGTPEQRLRARLTAFESGLEQGLRNQSRGPERLPQVSVASRATDSQRPHELLFHDAIDERRLIRFHYRGLERIAEPHVLGTKNARLQVLTWQTGGHSRSGPLPGWRRFFVNEISELEILDRSFSGRRWTGGRHSAFDRHIALVR